MSCKCKYMKWLSSSFYIWCSFLFSVGLLYEVNKLSGVVLSKTESKTRRHQGDWILSSCFVKCLRDLLDPTLKLVICTVPRRQMGLIFLHSGKKKKRVNFCFSNNFCFACSVWVQVSFYILIQQHRFNQEFYREIYEFSNNWSLLNEQLFDSQDTTP